MSETSVTVFIKSGTGKNTKKKGQPLGSNHCPFLLEYQAKRISFFEPLNCFILFSAIHSGAETVISPTDILVESLKLQETSEYHTLCHNGTPFLFDTLLATAAVTSEDSCEHPLSWKVFQHLHIFGSGGSRARKEEHQSSRNFSFNLLEVTETSRPDFNPLWITIKGRRQRREAEGAKFNLGSRPQIVEEQRNTFRSSAAEGVFGRVRIKPASSIEFESTPVRKLLSWMHFSKERALNVLANVKMSDRNLSRYSAPGFPK
ncbi:hypothetical protein CEXT_558841 [Caerostris extrusa]|uniref:Uncharacterized protein n=1 Tax=Caerostris extrusa TaxID=172846 RepID=A0AAV4XWL2_CAEEX|nr:hypothetical protein CEXT_558841 [Caerostris extrusa]